MSSSYKNLAFLYSQIEYSGTGFLAYRDLPAIISRYLTKGTALDYGCGTGDSTRLLDNLGFYTIGVDIDKRMLHEAVKRNNKIKYLLIKDDEQLPFRNEEFDLITVSLVLMEISSIAKIFKIFKELYRILKKSGIIVVTTTTNLLYQLHDWLTIKTDYIENKNLTSGCLVKVKLLDVNLDIIDYYWSDDNYKDVFMQANFEIVENLKPIGNKTDKFVWKAEKHSAPFQIYVLEK